MLRNSAKSKQSLSSHRVGQSGFAHDGPDLSEPTRAARLICLLLGSYALVGGAVSFAGWLLDFRRLTDWNNDGISIQPNAAIAVTAAGAALVFLTLGSRRIAAGIGGLVALIGASVLFQYVTAVNLGIDTLFMRDRTWGQTSVVSPGRMGPPGAISWTLIGLCLMLPWLSDRTKHSNLSSYLRLLIPSVSLITASVATLSIIGYLYGATVLYTIPRLTAIAFQTATFILAISLALVISVPERGMMRLLTEQGSAGILTRRILPAAIVVPLLLGLLRVSADRARLFDFAFGSALRTVLEIALFLILLWWTAKAIRRHYEKRKLAENALRESDARLSAVLSQLPVGLGVMDTEGRWIVSNAIMDELVPNAIPSSSPEQAARWRAHDERGHFIPPENWPGQRALRGEIVHGLEMIFSDDEARDRWMRVSAAPLRDDANCIVGATAVVQDINELKQAELALRDGERLQRLLARVGELGARASETNELIGGICALVGTELRVSRCGYTVADLEAGTFTVSRDYCDNLPSLAGVYRVDKYATDASFSQHSSAVDDMAVDPRSAPRYEELLAPLNMRACISVPLHREGQLAATFWVSQHEPRQWTATEVEFMKLIADRVWVVVERNRVEQALRESQSRLKGMIDSAMDAVIVVNAEQRIVLFNPAAERMFGCVSTDVLGSSLDQFIPEHLRSVHRTHIEDFGKTGITARRMGALGALTGRRANGDNFPIEASISHLEAGGEKLFTVILRDISERKLAEAEREKAFAREQELREAAEEANRLKDEFLAIMSHELRNPLNVILGYSELLLLSDEIKRSPQLLRMGEALKRNALTQSRLIRDLLDLSRLRSGKISLRLETVSLLTTIKNAVETVRSDAETKKIQIEVVGANSEPLFVEGDPVRLEQVVWNLLNNSVKFTASGGKINVRLAREDSNALITVVDTGDGIDSSFLPHVFELFRQEDTRTNRARTGMGIGLAVAQQLVELHKGSIWAFSAGPGKGATFSIKLPLSFEQKTTLPIPADIHMALENFSVLVVDDSADTTEMLVRLLKMSGAVVRGAASGEDGLRMIAENEFDAVISDISMPGMDGFEFLRRLRQLPGGSNVPVLALTGFGRPEDVQRAQAAGFYSHVTKPFEFEALVDVLQKLPKRRALMDTTTPH